MSVDDGPTKEDAGGEKLNEEAGLSAVSKASEGEVNYRKQSVLNRIKSGELMTGLRQLSLRKNASKMDKITSAELFTDFDMGRFTQKDFRNICENALKAVFETDAKFTDDPVVIKYYTIEDAQDNEVIEGMRAFECTMEDPPVKTYLDIIDRGDGNNMVLMYFEGKEYFRELRSQAHLEE